MPLIERRDQDFLLHEVFNVSQFSEFEKYADFNKKTCDMIVTEARNLAIKEILPTNKMADKENGHPDAVKLIDGQVKVPPSFHKPYKLFCDGQWLAMCDDPEFGGQGMPHLLAMAAGEYFTSANCAFMMYPGLTHGCGNILATFGTEKQKQLYVKNIFTGKWGGTMCLTEPVAGSDVGALVTKATPVGDGTYKIEGGKIFISGGDSDMVENMVHPVLARIEGAPAGTKGISLFLVPKYRVNDDGSLGEFNDVETVGIEEKMGIHGNATCTLAFGSKGNCIGELIGEPNKGMKYMFLMMNEARQGVAMQGLGFATASYCNAIQYAKERIQGPNLLKAVLEGDLTGVPIIQHPDVRRMLLFMKAYVEGCRFLVYFLNSCFDKANTTADEKEKTKWEGLIEILTPIAKSYCTDKAVEVASTGVQVYGGYGFIEEYPQAQHYRDAKITAIYEGTNGIQAMDLLGRKLGMRKGKPIMDLMGEINKTVAKARENGLEKIADSLQAALNKLGEVAMTIGAAAMSEKALDAFASATPFCEVAGDVVMAWAWAERAAVAKAAVEGAKKKDKPFYDGQIATAKYFYEQLLPTAMGKMDAVKNLTAAVMEFPEEAFVG
ncbi:acyl-CoA dehydrogenase [Desulfobotulus sp.]|jgi:alkylation response protein AidB-like acyl-CoA dehydrogenase|uniref:acyl-CoA dehydrogenase n=1 Tax=Desulfobotulus sp. TaxID=1940337 RepID=UPI002A371232|nr:acyl-CoA dehydrogenase [Desulfobotulus sp.]MDY0162728.1 acyl-CoA dehydrogenase [Desulfobotulus sp.]